MSVTNGELDKLRAYAGAATELQRLRDRVSELEDILSINPKRPTPLPAGLRPHAGVIVRMLLNREFISRATVIVALGHEGDEVGEKYADVHIFFARAWLREQSIELKNHRGVGWYLTNDEKKKIRSVMGLSS